MNNYFDYATVIEARFMLVLNQLAQSRFKPRALVGTDLSPSIVSQSGRVQNYF